jgi:C4-dicarboxylate transporter DctM subunit
VVRDFKALARFVAYSACSGGNMVRTFTPTEAGGVGAFGALLLALYKKKVTCRALLSTLLETGVTAGSIFIMLMSAQMYSRMLAISGVVNALADILTRLNLAPVVIVFFFMGVILIMGTLIDSISILLLTMPLMIPVVSAFGMDLVWFGVIAILATQIGLVTPPFGLGVFTIKASLTDELNELLEIEDIFKGSFPYFIMMTICLVILVLFPKITTYLPALM